MVFSVMYTICKGPNLDAYGCQSVTPANCHMILFININGFFSEKMPTLRHLEYHIGIL